MIFKGSMESINRVDGGFMFRALTRLKHSIGKKEL